MRVRLNYRTISILISGTIILFIFLWKNLSYLDLEKYNPVYVHFKVFETLQISQSTYIFRNDRYNHYFFHENYQTGEGEHGKAVVLTPEETKNLDKVIKIEAFNRPLSDRVSLQRSLPDFRSNACKSVKYPKNLPTLSVVIIFHNEAWSTLLRTAYSVVNRTPPNILKEVILLDDASTKEELGARLTEYVRASWPDGVVRIKRSLSRLGLIQARVEGAKATTGETLMFLDSHCEVTRGWAEPLLFRILQSHSAMLIPVIEGIDANNLAYYGSSELSNVGTFWWSMHFTWESIPAHFLNPNRKPTDPIKSATMAGGLFAANREYFFSIGAYDEGMGIWGGENLEISFRTWMCGGSLESSPCSHVGHIFRASHPYSFPGNKDYHGLNSKRLVDVWQDEYKRLFYMHRPELKTADAGNISSRVQLRQRLKCKSFKWFLQNIMPHKFIPDERVYGYGYVQNENTNMCLDLLAQNEFERGRLFTGIFHCQGGASSHQIFSLYPVNYSLSTTTTDPNNPVVLGQLRREWGCVTGNSHYDVLHFVNCQSSTLESQLWRYSTKQKTLTNVKFRQCLDSKGASSGTYIKLADCDNSSLFQKWTFQFVLH